MALPSPAGLPVLTAVSDEVSRFSCMQFLSVPGVYDYAGSGHRLALASIACVAFPFCPQGRHPGLFFSKLNTLPADASRLRFGCGLTTAAAKLEARWFAVPFL